jgi:hypothetical protein
MTAPNSTANRKKETKDTMTSAPPLQAPAAWIIADGRYLKPRQTAPGLENARGPVREYAISDLGRYLLAPHPIEIEKKLIGCEVVSPPGWIRSGAFRLRRLLPQRGGTAPAGPLAPSEVLISESSGGTPTLQEPNLEAHLARLEAALKPYNPVLVRLDGLEEKRVADLKGVCADAGGHRSRLNLRGSLTEKRDYIAKHLNRPVKVIIEKAYVADGLFELQGFDFKNFDPGKRHRLMRFPGQSEVQALVLNSDGSIAFQVADIRLLHYLQLFQQAIDATPTFRDALEACTLGGARAFKLYFNQHLEIDYAKAGLPAIYQSVVDAHPLNSETRRALIDSLNQLQYGIAFNYLPQSGPGAQKLFTHIAVMHNLRALDPLRDELPLVYSEINKRAWVSEAGRYYLLDAIKGGKHEQ